MSYAEVRHDADCLAAHMSDAACFCARAAWLDELVPRAQARAEVLHRFERWAREEEILDDGGLDATRTTLATDRFREVALLGITAARSINRAVWQRIAVGALNQRREAEERLAYVAAKERAAEAEPVPAPPRQVGTPAVDRVPPYAVDVVTTGDRL